MKKLFVFSAMTVSSLFASVALADEPAYPPCNGNYGITYPNRCTPQPQPPPPPVIPDEAFAAEPDSAVIFVEVQPIQAPQPQPTPEAQIPCTEAKPQPSLYQQKPAYRPLNTWAAQGKIGLFQNANRVREVGIRSMGSDGGEGGSGYFRTHRTNSRVGIELSIDGIDDVLLTQASLVGYSKREGIIKPFAFVGGGLYADVPGYSFQTGVGADINLTQRLTLNFDARYLVADEANTTYYAQESINNCFDCGYDYEQSFDGGIVSMGFGWKFGALGKQEKTLFQGRMMGSTANAFKSSASTGFATAPAAKSAWPNQSLYTYSQRYAKHVSDDRIAPWNQSRAMASWNQPQGQGAPVLNVPSIAPWNQSRTMASWNQPQSAAPKQGGLLQSGFKSGLKSPLDSYGFVREIGIRSFSDLGDGGSDTGGGLYFKTYRNNGRIGGEVSLDAIGSDTLAQATMLGYLNPKGTVRPYGLLGVGAEISSSEYTAQWGAGVDVSITNRFSLTADLRGIEGSGTYTEVDCDAGFCGDDSFSYISAFVGGLGVGYKF
jgi:hypothetical protein